MSVSRRYLLKCPLRLRKFSFFSVCRIFLSQIGMEFRETLLFIYLFICLFASFEVILWVSFLLCKCGILHWFLKVKLNLNIWDKPYLLVMYYYPVILLNSICYKVMIFITIFIWVVACSFPFSSHPSLIMVSRQSCFMEKVEVCSLLCCGACV